MTQSIATTGLPDNSFDAKSGDGVQVSIIICTRNRADHLRMTLASLATVVAPPALGVELLVVDNGSTDATRSVVESAELGAIDVRYLFEPEKGQSCARNRGVAASRGQALLFTDDDVRFPRNWIEGMSANVLSRTGEAVSVAGGVKLAPHLVRPWFEPYHLSMFADTSTLDQRAPELLVGANMAISRKLWDHAPEFDDELGPGKLGFGEDTLFALQLQEAGYELVPAFDISVEHHFQESRLQRTSLIDAAKRRGRSSGYIMHHWNHDALPRLAGVRLLRLRLRLAMYRLMHSADTRRAEGLSADEGSLISAMSRLEQLVLESRRTRNYVKRGLTKLTHDSCAKKIDTRPSAK